MSVITDDNKIAMMLLWQNEISEIRKATEKNYDTDLGTNKVDVIDWMKLRRISREIAEYLQEWQ